MPQIKVNLKDVWLNDILQRSASSSIYVILLAYRYKKIRLLGTKTMNLKETRHHRHVVHWMKDRNSYYSNHWSH